MSKLNLVKTILIGFINMLCLNIVIVGSCGSMDEPIPDISQLCDIKKIERKSYKHLMENAYTNQKDRHDFYTKFRDGKFFFEKDETPSMDQLFPPDKWKENSWELVELMMLVMWAPERLTMEQVNQIQLSSQRESVEAQTILGYMHQFEYERFNLLDKDRLKNHDEALRLYTEAAHNLFIWAQYYLGKILYESYEDPVDGFKYLSQAGSRGHLSAQKLLISKTNTEHSREALKDPHYSLYWVKKVAKKGDLENEILLANKFDEWEMRENAYKYYLRSAVKGDVSSQLKVGYYYNCGWGIVQNREKAVNWYKLAAAGGDKTACYNLGLCYEQNAGVERNEGKAFRWFQLAADRGEVDGCRKVASYYHHGLGGVAQDHNQAIKYYIKAQMIKYSTKIVDALDTISPATAFQLALQLCRDPKSKCYLLFGPSDLSNMQFPELTESDKNLINDIIDYGKFYWLLSSKVSDGMEVLTDTSEESNEFMTHPELQKLSEKIAGGWSDMERYLQNLENASDKFIFIADYVEDATDDYLDLIYYMGTYTLISVDPSIHGFMRNLRNHLDELKNNLDKFDWGIKFALPYSKQVKGLENLLQGYAGEVDKHLKFLNGLEGRIENYIIATAPQRTDAFWKEARYEVSQ